MPRARRFDGVLRHPRRAAKSDDDQIGIFEIHAA
jgi:hypothetical protein